MRIAELEGVVAALQGEIEVAATRLKSEIPHLPEILGTHNVDRFYKAHARGVRIIQALATARAHSVGSFFPIRYSDTLTHSRFAHHAITAQVKWNRQPKNVRPFAIHFNSVTMM